MRLSIERIRKNVMNKGGAYYPLAGLPGKVEFYDFLSVVEKKTGKGCKLYALAGSQILYHIRDITHYRIGVSKNLKHPFSFVENAQQKWAVFNNPFSDVNGEYPIELNLIGFSVLESFDTINNDISCITGKYKMPCSMIVIGVPENSPEINMNISYSEDGKGPMELDFDTASNPELFWRRVGFMELAA